MDLEVIAEKQTVDYEYECRALDIVKKFVIERKLIIYGGMAINFALKLKGSSIYRNDEKPDIDAFSDDPVKNAYDLADILKEKGFLNVAVIRGVHVSTMRVRTNFIYVMDISYVEPKIYKNIPTINFNNMHIVHPLYQRMDMHISLSFPFGGCPRENIFNRWEKDYERLMLIDQHYPVPEQEFKGKFKSIKIPIPKGSFGLMGFAAYGAIYTTLLELCGRVKEKIIDVPKIKIAASKAEMSIETPEETFTIIKCLGSNETAEASHNGDKLPPSHIENNLEIYYLKTQLLGANLVKINDIMFTCVNIHYVMLYMLTKYFITLDNLYLTFYNATWKIVHFADEIFRKHGIEQFLVNSPFSFNTKTIGTENVDKSYLVRMAKNIRATRDREHIPKDLDKLVLTILDKLPKEYYDTRPTVQYDYKNLEFNL
jgi:hypothetical protein